MSTKATKGTVKLVDRSGVYYLDFRVNGKRYRPSTNLAVNPTNTKALKQIASRIELDIAMGQFNPDLTHYLATTIKHDAKAVKADTSLATLYPLYLSGEKLDGITYLQVQRFIEADKPTWDNLTKVIDARNWSATTHNKYVGILNGFINWVNSKHDLRVTAIPTRANAKPDQTNRRPFTDNEITLIIDAFATDRFVPKCSRYKHSHYLPMVKFLFLTGCRLGEVVGLKAKHIDLEAGTVTICESLSKENCLSSKRVQKGTKTGTVRVLSIPDSLIKREIKRLESLEPENYVFTGFKGEPIAQNNFTQRVWKQVLAGLGIEYRVPYAARHTMASRAIEQGIPITGVAYLMGHSDTTMVMKQYGHMINRPNLPTINLGA